MGKTNHDFWRRNSICIAVLFAALGGFSVGANAAQAPGFDNFLATVTGDSATVGFATNGTAVVTKPSGALGGSSGWSSAPNFGIGRTTTGAVIGQIGEVGLASGRVPVTAASAITKGAALAGMGRMIGALVPLGNLVVGGFLLSQTLADVYNAANVKLNKRSDGTVDPVNPFLTSDDIDGKVYFELESQRETGPYYFSPVPIAEKYHASRLLMEPYLKREGSCVQVRPGEGAVNCPTSNSGGATFNWSYGFPSKINTTVEFRSTNWDGARPKFEASDIDVQKLVQAQLDQKKRSEQNGIKLDWGIDVAEVKTTGPATLEPVTEVKKTTKLVTGPDGITREVTETKTTTKTRPVTYTKDGVKIEPVETTTTVTETKNPDGSVDTKTETEKTETATTKDDSDLCKTNPDILACSKPELDTPDGEIPKTQKEITFTPENPFGDGNCPADVYYTLHSGQSLKVWNWAVTCQYSLPIRALVIGLSTFAAFLIVMPGSTRT